MFIFFPDAVKRNPPTSSVTKSEVENKLKTWLGNSRDRGEDSRKKGGTASK